MYWRIWCWHIDHALLGSYSWYRFTKFLNKFFKSFYHFLEMYVLNIEENYLTWQLFGNFLIPQEQFCRTGVKRFVNLWRVFTLHLVNLVVLIFYFDLPLPFNFLKSSRYFLACENLQNFSCCFWKHQPLFFQT